MSHALPGAVLRLPQPLFALGDDEADQSLEQSSPDAGVLHRGLLLDA